MNRIKFFESIACLVAGFIFLFVILGVPAVRSESSFQLAYTTIGVDAILFIVLLAYFLAHLDKFGVFLYFFMSGSVAVASWIVVFLIASIRDTVDSSHGGSIFIVVAGSIAMILGGSVVLLQRKRNL